MAPLAAERRTTGPGGTLARRYLDAQLAANRHEALRLIVDEGLRRGWTVEALLLDVIQRAQRDIGRLWEQNRITIADEHVATAISQFVLARLYAETPREAARGRKVAIACVEGELHDMGARVAADLLDLRGFDVIFLGASVPPRSLAARLVVDPPDLVALSVTMTFHLPALRAAVAATREAAGAALPIIAGGHAFEWSPEAGAGLTLAATSRDAREMAADVCRILGC